MYCALKFARSKPTTVCADPDTQSVSFVTQYHLSASHSTACCRVARNAIGGFSCSPFCRRYRCAHTASSTHTRATMKFSEKWWKTQSPSQWCSQHISFIYTSNACWVLLGRGTTAIEPPVHNRRPETIIFIRHILRCSSTIPKNKYTYILCSFLIVSIQPITICLHGFQREPKMYSTLSAHVFLSSEQKLIGSIKIYALQTRSSHESASCVYLQAWWCEFRNNR